RPPPLHNADVTIYRCRPAQPQAELYRNADADEVIFVHKGSGSLSSLFGTLPFRPFDYVVVPRCTTYRLDFDAGVQPDLLVIEAAGQINIPPKYLNHDGQLRLGAPYSERDLHGPGDQVNTGEEKDTHHATKHGTRTCATRQPLN